MDEPIKILHVVGRMDRGGTEALLMSLLRTIDRTKFQYDFVEQTQKFCDYDEEILSYGCIIHRCPQISPTNLRQYRLWWRNFFREHPEYRIVHGHSRGSGPIYLDEAKRAGRITIAHCHNNSCGSGIRGIIRYICQIPLRYIADYNFACSYDAGVSQFGKHRKFEVINNGILSKKYAWNLRKRDELRREMNLEECFVIGNVARFILQKNHKFLISVFAEIKKKQPNAKLLLIGEGPLESDIRTLVSSHGLESDVVFTGLRSDVHELMQAMDVFVLPSNFEGLGIVNVEAQVSGLPCFVSDKVVPQEVKLTELMHFIPLEHSAAEWAEYILAHAIAPEERRDHSQEIIDAGFDIQTTAHQLHTFYQDVLAHE